MYRRRISGTLLDTSLELTDRRLLEEGSQDINPRHELQWLIDLEPGQDRTISYRYKPYSASETSR